MISNQKLNLIKLARTEKLGQSNFFRLMSMHNNDATLAVEVIKNNKHFKVPSDSYILDEIETLNKINAKILTYQDEEYPWMLKSINDFPPIISVIGDLSQESYKQNRSISIVGSRNCSVLGKKFTQYIVKELVNRNFTVISGLANGIDQAAHEETIKNQGNTIAVIGCGLSDFYPNIRLGHEIIENGGVIISELPFSQKPQPRFFPQRNRIIAGISLCTLIVEATIKSGSMITAGQAIKYNRTVFSVPGFPTDDRSSGTNQLIKDGAVMVRKIDDIIEELQDNSFINRHSVFSTVTKNKKKTEMIDIFESTNSSSNLNSLDIQIINLLNGKTEINLNDLFVMLPNMCFNSILIAISELESKNIIMRNAIGQISLM